MYEKSVGTFTEGENEKITDQSIPEFSCNENNSLINAEDGYEAHCYMEYILKQFGIAAFLYSSSETKSTKSWDKNYIFNKINRFDLTNIYRL